MSNKKSKPFDLAGKMTLILSRIMPGWAERKIHSQLFLFNTRQVNKLKTPRDFIQKSIQTNEGEINYYQTGHGPVVVFVHGWGGSAFQFFTLMRGLKAIGFTALAFDHLGHGASQNRSATIQQSIQVTNQMLEFARKSSHDGLAAVIGHDTGCMLIANARPGLIKNLPLFLIAPVFNYRLHFLRKLNSLKLNPSLLKKYAQQFVSDYSAQYAPLELSRKLKPYADNTVIAHDVTDSIAAFEESKKFCDQYPLTKLLATQKWDHNLIISSESVWQELKSLLNYDDTTINFTQLANRDKD
jgi:pimeloyl-ACP methyl ester carboxylesterase